MEGIVVVYCSDLNRFTVRFFQMFWSRLFSDLFILKYSRYLYHYIRELLSEQHVRKGYFTYLNYFIGFLIDTNATYTFDNIYMDILTLDLTPMIPVYNNVSYLSVDIQCSFFIYIITINKKIYNCLHFDLFSCYGLADSVFCFVLTAFQTQVFKKEALGTSLCVQTVIQMAVFLSNDATGCVCFPSDYCMYCIPFCSSM